MHRDDWQSVFINQDEILKRLKPLENDMFLAGGTGLQRFVLPMPYRHSEDLDFFFPALKTKQELDEIKNKILELISSLHGVKLYRDPIWIKDEQSWRMFFVFEDNDEIIKIELLNFTCTRIKDLTFLNQDIFKTENLYNLLLYKFKALCDRPDTIKDLFDIYFILRSSSTINIKTLLDDMNKKFYDAIDIKYTKEDIIKSLSYRLDWDIEIGDHVNHLHGLKLEINSFQEELKVSFEYDENLDFSYASKISKKAKEFELTNDEYINLIEDNQFVVDEWKKLYESE